MISLVIPVYNEKESLAILHGEIVAIAAEAKLDLEVVFVDDGSRDGSWDAIAALATTDPGVRGIRFRRNFGKAAALLAGFRAARGDRIVTLDADLQDDPKEIPRFMEMLDDGLDVDSLLDSRSCIRSFDPTRRLSDFAESQSFASSSNFADISRRPCFNSSPCACLLSSSIARAASRR